MEEEVSYIANDARCLSAIEDLAAGMETLNWLGKVFTIMFFTYLTNDIKGTSFQH